MKKIMKDGVLGVLRGLVLGMAVLMVAVPAQAVPSTLGDLNTNNGYIQQGDKLFNEFYYIDVNGNGPGAANINVSGNTTAGYHGVQFQGGFIDLPGPPSLDIYFGYTVSVTDYTKEISDIHVAANLAIFGVGATSSLTMEAFDGTFPYPLLGSVTLTNPPSVLSGFDVFPYSVPKAYIVNRLQLDGGAKGIATLSFDNNWLSQVSVPEPATILLLGSGLLGMGFVNRKQKISR